MTVRKVVIIGSGPAGYTAAIYAARADLRPLLLTGSQPGGQLLITSDVENYPGFPDGVLGPDLMEMFRKQAERFGAEVIDGSANEVDFYKRPFKVIHDRGSEEALTVIIATGASARWLDLPSEQRLIGRGVSACATCDGYFFRGKDVAVVGGGDTAMEESTFLTKFANRVTVIHRRDRLRASKIMQRKASENPKIGFIWDSAVEEVLGKDRVEGIRIKNLKTNNLSELQVQGLFIAIGYTPNTEIFRGQIEMDQLGYIIPMNNTETNVKGVFVAGDVHDRRYRQAVTAAGSGCQAAMDAEKFLEEDGPQ
jgi:thioredoxin reductase (NADPH)